MHKEMNFITKDYILENNKYFKEWNIIYINVLKIYISHCIFKWDSTYRGESIGKNLRFEYN